MAGLRTPFCKMGTAYAKQSALSLGSTVVQELLERHNMSPGQVDRVVYGQVVPSLSAPNIAREIVLDTGMPRTTDAFSVSRACATSYQSTIDAAQAIMLGEIDCAIAGGADSASDVPIAVRKPLAEALIKLSRAKSLPDRLRSLSSLRPRDLLPEPPALVERSTGLSMGQSAEKMAQENGIPRSQQDELAHRSHTNAAKAWADGRLREEVMTVLSPPKYDKPTSEDNMVRKESKVESYAKLRPVFDRKHGTITAGNSSPLTDGASALIAMNEEKAKAEGLPVLATIRSYAFTALDPSEQLLMGPAYATPLALKRAGIEFGDLDLIDIHEAFAAQVLSVTQAWESKGFAKTKLGQGKAVGSVDWSKVNVTGGSIAIGHPFAATGVRQLTQTANELRRRGGGLGLVTACAAGGLGAAIVFEVGK